MNKKKILLFSLVFAFAMILFPGHIYAANGYDFKLEYDGDVVEGQEKAGKVLLIGTNGTTYTNVRVKVDITGPATPKIIGTDAVGNEFDITKIGYWGPAAGFAVQGTFTNTTPIKALYSKAGNYTTVISLIDVKNGNAVITSKTINVKVLDQPMEEPTTDNTVEELPKTGNSVMDYLLYIVPAMILIAVLGVTVKYKRNNTHS